MRRSTVPQIGWRIIETTKSLTLWNDIIPGHTRNMGLSDSIVASSRRPVKVDGAFNVVMGLAMLDSPTARDATTTTKTRTMATKHSPSA